MPSGLVGAHSVVVNAHATHVNYAVKSKYRFSCLECTLTVLSWRMINGFMEARGR